MCQNLLFYLLLYKKKIFDQIHIDLFYYIRFKRLFNSRVWLCRAQAVWRFTETDLGNFGPWTFGSRHFGPIVSVQFLGHSGLSWVSAAPSSGHLDPLTIPLSFFRESKAVLALTIIFFEDTSCFKLATNGQSDKEFLLTSNFVPKGLSVTALGLYTCIKSFKMC